MVGALTLIVGCNGWQSIQLYFSTQRVNDPQYVFQSQRGLACLKVNDETHTNACCQSQLRLCQPEALPGGTQCISKLLRCSYSCHA